MSVLSDYEIKKLSKSSNLIKPLIEEQLNPHGYDLAIQSVWVNNKLLEHKEDFDIMILPRTFFIVNTKETVNLKDTPLPLIAKLWIKTSFARQGIILSDGLIDCGFKGTLNLCCYNASNTGIYLVKQQPFCQVVFETATPPEKGYAQRSGNYQNQKTVMFAGVKQ